MAEFLVRQGHSGIQLEPLTGDASTRRYFRLREAGLLLMEVPNDSVGLGAYERLSQHLLSLNLSAPRVYDTDPDNGLALIEDYGDSTYAACLAKGADEGELYQLAVSTLLHIHHDARGPQVRCPDYDLNILLDEINIFSDWFAPVAACSEFNADSFSTRFRCLWRNALASVATHRDTLVLRDFHIDNLILLDNRDGVRRCGLLDFQDGVIGPCEFDLVSLLQDARRDLALGLEEEMLAYYIRNAPKFLGSADDIRARYAVLGAQRHARIAGVFLRLCRRDGKPRYLTFLPRVLRQLDVALKNAGLIEISDFLDHELPDWRSAGERITANTNLTTPRTG